MVVVAAPDARFLPTPATNPRRRVLFAMSVALLTDGAFATDVLAHPGLVVVDVWAEWCTPCRALVPIFNTLAERYDGRVRVAKLDADANLETVTRYDVRALPTVLIFQGGVLVERLSGARSLGSYVDAIDAHLARRGEAVVAVPSVERTMAPPATATATTSGESDAIREARALLSHHEAMLVFKHSNACPVSFTAKRQFDQFTVANPDVPTRLVVIQQERELSNALETVSRLRHESPQALIVRDGRVLWDASHGGITKPRLEQAFVAVRPPG
jgi:thioredoxin 1